MTLNLMNILFYFIFNLSQVLTSNQNLNEIPKISGKPLIVSMELYTDDINSINEKDMDFRLDFYLRHQWNVSNPFCDLYQQNLQKSNIKFSSPEDSVVLTYKEFSDHFWVPDTFLTNAKKEGMPSKIIDTRVLRIKYENNLCQMEYIARLAAIVGCPMDFHGYPIEKTNCKLEFRSYTYQIDSIIYKWGETATPMNPNLRLSQHDLFITNGNGFTFVFDDKFSVVYANFTLKRRIMNKLTQVYSPSILIVGLSWLSFWISLKAIPGRVALIVTCLLALISQFISVRQELPQVSYINKIDIWMLACMMFIFGSLLEFTIVKFIARKYLMEQLLESESDFISIKDDNFLNPTQFYYTSPEYPFVCGINDHMFEIIRKRMSIFYNAKRHSNIGIQLNQETDKMELKSHFHLKSYDNSGPLKQILCNKQNNFHISGNPLKNADENEVVWHTLFDKISRIMFPVCFCLFSLIYWTVLLTMK